MTKGQEARDGRSAGSGDTSSAGPGCGAPLSGDIVLPVGAKVISQSLSGNRLSIDAELADGSHSIFVYDIAERRIVGQFAIRNK